MRLQGYLILVFVLILAACGGGSKDTPSADVPAVGDLGPEAATFQAQIDAALTDATPIPTVTPAGEGALIVPVPGTLVASETQDPEPRGLFDYVSMTQTGGREDITLVIQVYSDGRVIRDGVEGRVESALVAEIDNAINTLNFFGMQGAMLGPPGGADTYRYRVIVKRGFQERAIWAQDGFMPNEFIQLLSLIRDAGDGIGG